LEVLECINLLRGEIEPSAKPVLDLSVQLSAHMLVLSETEQALDAAHARLQRVLDSGAALDCLQKNILAQGGDARVCDSPADFLPLVKNSVKVESPRSGYIKTIDTAEIGHTVAAIGGGRIRIEDVIDPTVGFIAETKIGDQVKAGDVIGVVYCGDSANAEEAARRIGAAYQIGDEPPALEELVKEVINE
jgi:thymidine phosphorylase